MLHLLTGLTFCALPKKPTMGEIHEASRLVDQGTVHLRAGRIEKAQASFQLAYELAKLPAALDGLGCAAFLAGNPEAAQQFFLRAYQMEEHYTHSLGNLAMLYETLGYQREAQILYRRAISENPRSFRFRNNFAGFLIDSQGVSHLARQVAREELLKAQSLAEHPLIEHNISQLE